MLFYEFHPLAERELSEAVDYYEDILPGKGLELAREVRAAILQVCEFPESAPVSRGAVRSIVVQPDSRWSFTVHYHIKLPTFGCWPSLIKLVSHFIGWVVSSRVPGSPTRLYGRRLCGRGRTSIIL